MNVLAVRPENVIRVISIDKETVSPVTLTYIRGHHAYFDEDLGQNKSAMEHLFDCEVRDIVISLYALPAVANDELIQIEEICKEHNASYFRIVEF